MTLNVRDEAAPRPALNGRRGQDTPAVSEKEMRGVITSYATPTSKRLLDVLVSTLLLSVLWPVCVLAIWLIKRDSPGPALIAHKRVGLDGKAFDFYKFRSMVEGSEDTDFGRIPTGDLKETLLSPTERDPRITAVGAVLRKTTVDELPQLLNVIRGDMSLVGPRPDIPEIVDSWPEHFHQRHKVKPGMTGLAQVNGRSDITHFDKIRYDLDYVRHHPISRDLAILAKTVALVISKKGAR